MSYRTQLTDILGYKVIVGCLNTITLVRGKRELTSPNFAFFLCKIKTYFILFSVLFTPPGLCRFRLHEFVSMFSVVLFYLSTYQISISPV